MTREERAVLLAEAFKSSTRNDALSAALRLAAAADSLEDEVQAWEMLGADPERLRVFAAMARRTVDVDGLDEAAVGELLRQVERMRAATAPTCPDCHAEVERVGLVCPTCEAQERGR
jgi:hypothetical protein